MNDGNDEFESLALSYVAVWNETDSVARRAAVERILAPEIRYTDPIAVAEGCDAVDAMIGAVQGQFPGLTMTLAGPVDGHHDQARFTWGLGPAGAEPLVVGFDVIERGADGRITKVLGFLDKVPAGAGAGSGA
ncbi:SnoaL-like domain-containing protein [Parafrankia irregularis]|uniref:SnoaL-like domain-containing protein n=1 Tax=Parafrankia irregularis TaxID=795642 RepID=A0A0S4QWI5_9ACTN|nr:MULTISPECIES: nuclear transport factor 2 family protein [Parafrankia]MBE3206437.1 nuclear transport factor 2 family protein [Parafrankia sp. CH37]CUU59885.1 SnoaL-like domain-containing protein [Parafrankia irregularis]